MSAHLDRIREAGFSVELGDGVLLVTPYSSLTGTQLQFLNDYKTAIMGELMKEALELNDGAIPAFTSTNPMTQCRDCIHFNSHHKHGCGSGTCALGVDRGAPCLWSESLHQCENHAPRPNQQQDTPK